jgi:lysozyme family protein
MTEQAIEFVLAREGGWYPGNDPRDPNPTMYGVTQTTYDGYRRRRQLPVRSVREISMSEVREIYVPYWKAAGCDLVGKASGIALFDHSIKAGPDDAVKALQKAVGAIPDGIIGPATRRAIASWSERDRELAARICFERIRFYVDLAKSVRLRPNLLSWVHRVIIFRENYLK